MMDHGPKQAQPIVTQSTKSSHRSSSGVEESARSAHHFRRHRSHEVSASALALRSHPQYPHQQEYHHHHELPQHIQPLQSMPAEAAINRKLSRKKRARRAAKQAKKQLNKIIRRMLQMMRRNKTNELNADQFDELGLIGIVPSHTLEYAYSVAQATADGENRSTFEPYDATDSVVSEITNDVYCLRAASTDRGFEMSEPRPARASIQSPEFSFSYSNSKNNRKKTKATRFSFGTEATLGVHSQDGSAIQDLYSRDCRERERYHKIREGTLMQPHLTTVLDEGEEQNNDDDSDHGRKNADEPMMAMKEEPMEQPVVVEASSTLTSKSDLLDEERRNSVVLDLGGFFGCDLRAGKEQERKKEKQPVPSWPVNEDEHRPIDVDEFNNAAALVEKKQSAKKIMKKKQTQTQTHTEAVLGEKKHDERKISIEKQASVSIQSNNDGSEEDSSPQLVQATRVDTQETEASSSSSSTEDETAPSSTIEECQPQRFVNTANLPKKISNPSNVTPSKFPKGARWGVNLATVKDRPKWIETDLPLIGDGVYPSANASAYSASNSNSSRTIATGESSQGIDSILGSTKHKKEEQRESSCTEDKINSILGEPPSTQQKQTGDELLISPVRSPAAPKNGQRRSVVQNIFSPSPSFGNDAETVGNISPTGTASTVEESDGDVDRVMEMKVVRPSLTSAHRQPSQNTAFSSIDWKKQPSVSSSQWGKSNASSQRSLMQSVGYSMTSLMNALSPKTNCSKNKQPPISRARFSSLSTAKHSMKSASTPPRTGSTRKSEMSVQSRVAAINQRLLSKRIVRKKEERRETAGEGVLCPRKSKLINPLFRHHSSPTLPSMVEAYQSQCGKEGERACSSVLSDEGQPLQRSNLENNSNSFPRAASNPQSKFKLSRTEVFDDIMAEDKENSPNVPRLRLESSVGVAVKPDAMNSHNASAPILSSSDLCLSPKRRTPHQAQKWRTLAAEYGNNSSYNSRYMMA
eukprot:CAMPEP_0116032456 /NCGR_PEP_ID=MMETSP0321-20121206/18184_1 /TAXON_ID=163516 /ORGANISM="Leptocylindrus danicus var. danicus, Strain B650" /LENGTH=977 /DNA_ID=CAMNT_0003507903 /DNA_START=207 /DNA_END=3140 /DNA_ORIENTATION=+